MVTRRQIVHRPEDKQNAGYHARERIVIGQVAVIIVRLMRDMERGLASLSEMKGVRTSRCWCRLLNHIKYLKDNKPLISDQ